MYIACLLVPYKALERGKHLSVAFISALEVQMLVFQ